jgi:hypothetical protein
VGVVRLLLERGADPKGGERMSAPWGSEWTPCLYAAAPNVEIMKALLDRGADPNTYAYSRDDVMSEHSVLDAASTPEARELLISHGGRGATSKSPVVERWISFDPADHAPFEREGTATVEGTASIRFQQITEGDTILVSPTRVSLDLGGAGRVAPAAGEQVFLIPATPYSWEWWERGILGDELLADSDPRAARLHRSARADEGGRFRFDKVPAGAWFAYCRFHLTWEPPLGGLLASSRGILAARITVRDGERHEIALSRVRSNPSGAHRTLIRNLSDTVKRVMARLASRVDDAMRLSNVRAVLKADVSNSHSELEAGYLGLSWSPGDDPSTVSLEVRLACAPGGSEFSKRLWTGSRDDLRRRLREARRTSMEIAAALLYSRRLASNPGAGT